MRRPHPEGEAAARVAAGPGVSWHTADSAVLAEGQRVLTGDEEVAMDAFTGLKTTTVERPPGPPRLGFRNLANNTPKCDVSLYSV